MPRLALAFALALTAMLATTTSAGAANATFSNTSPITFADVGQSSLSPSDINVAGMTGVITDVNVFLTGFSHLNPDDVELLLEGPFGQTTVLMNDAGGTSDVGPQDLAFNDQAAGQIPDGGPILITDFGFKPSDYEMIATEPHIDPDAPPPPYGLTLSLTKGTNPNGVWRLYSGEDAFNASTGSIAGGWSISITTTDVSPATPTPATPPTATQPTGLRAAALKKCAKIKNKKKKKKCKRRARALPV